jgi:hypothetical protein
MYEYSDTTLCDKVRLWLATDHFAESQLKMVNPGLIQVSCNDLRVDVYVSHEKVSNKN